MMNRLVSQAASLDWKTASAAVKTAKDGWEMFTNVRDRWQTYQNNKMFTVVVDEFRNETAYDALSAWFSEQIPVEEVKLVEARVIRDGKIKFMYSNSTAQVVKINGHPVSIHTDTEAPSKKKSGGGALTVSEDGETRAAFGLRKLYFKARDAAGFEATKRFIHETIEEARRGPSRFYVAGQWGWNSSGLGVERRPMDAVVLKQGIKEMLINDVDKFLSQEQAYIDLGIPWHRGYLFHGPPGTGKTSIAQAIAAYIGTHVYYISLNSIIEGDKKLVELISGVGGDRKGAVLILEDIDTVRASHDRDEANGNDSPDKVTLQGLLNVLDGVLTPNGLLSIMTTNNKDALDKALIRPGRADKIVEITYVDDEQLSRLCERFVGHPVELPPVGNLQITPATVVGIFKEQLDDRGDALMKLRRFILNGADTDRLDLIQYHPSMPTSNNGATRVKESVW
jgi:hypothetical protein